MKNLNKHSFDIKNTSEKCLIPFLWVGKFCWISAFLVVNKKQLLKDILNSTRIQVTQIQCSVFFPWLVHLSFCKYINFEQFWILLLIRPGIATKSWWSHASILLWTRCTSSLIYLVHSRFGLQSTIYSIHGTEDNL